jgi:hypothetical protein
MTTAAFPQSNTAIAHLSDVLGDQRYESLARKGETMTTATMATYAYDQTCAELNAVSKQTTYESLKTPCRRWHGDMTDSLRRSCRCGGQTAEE